MKLEFIDVSAKNFLSIGSQAVKLEYSRGLNAITGQVIGHSTSNGSGKSSIGAEVLCFALYGKTIRKLNKDQIINAINERECQVTVRFRIKDTVYRIERGIKPDYLHLINESEDKEKEKASKKSTQDDINNLLGLSYKSFINLITLNINYSKPFFRMEKAEKREFLEQIMNLSIYGRMYEKTKKEYNELKSEIRNFETEIQTSIKAYKDKIETYKKIQELQKTFEQTKQQKIEDLKIKIQSKETELSDLSSKLPPEINKETKTKITEAKYKLLEIQSNIRSKISSAKSDVQQKERKITNIERNPICKECGTPTTSEHVQSHISEIKTEISTLQDSINKYEAKLVECNTKLSEITQKLQKIESSESLINTLNNNIHRKETEIHNLQQSLKETEQSTFSANNVISKESLLKDKANIELRKESYNVARKKFIMCETMRDILGDKGIKNFTIKKILPHLNQKMNKHLATMRATYTIKFDGELNETLKSKHRDEMVYENFSAGEQKRIDVAWLFTILDISRMRNSVDCNVLILDEVLDSSMCANGINHLMEYLKIDFKREYPNMCTYIITHKSEISYDDFDKIVKVKKENGFTKIID
jgi:DNA repair exonuclease SbcCD ATPase subunit